MFIRQLPTDSKNSIIMENQQTPQQQVFIQQAPAPRADALLFSFIISNIP